MRIRSVEGGRRDQEIPSQSVEKCVNSSNQQAGVGILEAGKCVCVGEQGPEKRPRNCMKSVEGQRCWSVGLFCAGDKAMEGREAKSFFG